MYKHLSLNIPDSIMVHINPASVHHARKAGDRCRSQPPIGDRPNFFSLNFSLRSVALRHQRRFSPIPRQILAFVARKVADRNTSSAFLHDPTIMPDLRTIRSTETLCVRADCSCRACARAASRAVVIYLRPRTRLPICILSVRRVLSRAIPCVFSSPAQIVPLPSARVGFRFHSMTATMGGSCCWNCFLPSGRRICDSCTEGCESFPPSLANIWDWSCGTIKTLRGLVFSTVLG